MSRRTLEVENFDDDTKQSFKQVKKDKNKRYEKKIRSALKRKNFNEIIDNFDEDEFYNAYDN